MATCAHYHYWETVRGFWRFIWIIDDYGNLIQIHGHGHQLQLPFYHCFGRYF